MLKLARADAGSMMIKSKALSIVYVLFKFIFQYFPGIDQQGCEHTGASKQANV